MPMYAKSIDRDCWSSKRKQNSEAQHQNDMEIFGLHIFVVAAHTHWLWPSSQGARYCYCLPGSHHGAVRLVKFRCFERIPRTK